MPASYDEVLRKETAAKLEMPYDTIDIVIGYKWKSVAEAIRNHTSVEDSGFGKFLIREKRVLKELNKFELILQAYNNKLINKREELTEGQLSVLEKRIESCKSVIDYLNSKLKKEE